MLHQKEERDMENIFIQDKYSKFLSEIERFIELKKKKQTKIKGKVEEIDLSNNILTIRLQLIQELKLSRGSLILIKEDNLLNLLTKYERATVKEIYNSLLKIETKTEPSEFENKNVILDINNMNVALERLENIIESIKNGEIGLDNLRILDIVLGEKKPKYSKKRIFFVSKRLNENQKEAIIKSIEADDFHMVIGPPGTGKTYVIEELIKQFSTKNQKLLITAWTNLAVDNIIKRLSEREYKKIVRIGPINEIDPQVRKYSIFEKMKKHKNWKEVEKCNLKIDELIKLKFQKRTEINLMQNSVNKIKNEKKVLKEELDNFINEEQKYKAIEKTSVDYVNFLDISSINNEMTLLNQKSESYLLLSKNIVQIKDIQTKIPEIKYIIQLKNEIKSIRLSILGKRISSFFLLTTKNKELGRLKQQYEKNRKYLNEILELQRKCDDLKKQCEKQFVILYNNENGQPDKDALNFEFKIYKILESQYIPSFKEQEELTVKRRTLGINQEVNRIYLDFLKIQKELSNIKIKSLNTDMYIQINHKNDLEKQYENLSSSLECHKKNVERLKRVIITEIIDDADLIAATAISSCHYFLDNIFFDIMIMDEASQVASFMSLLPLFKCKKFILVGDNKQLQPIEDADISKEMNLSIFNRLFEKYSYASTLLTTQYRMHRSIAKIANDIFYDGKLKTFEGIAEEILDLKIEGHHFLNPKLPVIIIDTSKTEFYEDGIGSGCSNIKEAKYITNIVSSFIKNGIKSEQIGIITPYVNQKLKIKELLKNIEIKDVEVDTIHKFQGKEKDVIIMSFAKSKECSFSHYNLRFIENETLINVAITRAKKKLILVGNLKTLGQSILLKKVIDKIGKENTITLNSMS